MSDAMLIMWSLLTPLLGAVAVAIVGRRSDEGDNVRDGVTVLASLTTLAFVSQLLPRVLAGEQPQWQVLELLPGLSLSFTLEPLGMLYAMVAACLWVPTSLYAFGYMRDHHEHNQTRFFVCFALAIFAALGIAFADNLLTLFLFYEVLTFSTFPLVTHAGTADAVRAGRIYLGILVLTSVTLLLFAVLWTWHLAGTLTFAPGGILAGKVDGWFVPLLFAMFAFGTGKAALMPFHRWLPNAMVAPTPVSALLHAVAVVKAGVFTVLKITVYVFGVDFLSGSGASDLIVWVAAFTLLSSSLYALSLDNLKARLAYSTISQLAYIVLGAALATQASVLGAGMHILMHAVGKITLFFCAGAILVRHHKSRVSQLDGIGHQMPWTMTAFLLGSLSIIGLPPFGGAWSKWYLVLGALDREAVSLLGLVDVSGAVFAGVYLLSSLLSIGYLMPIVVRAFFRPLAQTDHDHDHDHAGSQEASWLCVAPLCLTGVGSLGLFFYADSIHTLLRMLPLGGV